MIPMMSWIADRIGSAKTPSDQGERPDRAQPATLQVGCVVLTQGKRPDELKRAIESLFAQRDVAVDVVVVNNGGDHIDVPGDVRMLTLQENHGIPGGRNAGIDMVDGDLLLFIDDDAALRGDDFVATAAAQFAADPKLGVLQPRVVDPAGRRSPRRFVPRLRVGDDRQASDVAALWEGTLVARRDAVEKAGRWPSPMFYMHEGVELAWRVIDAGYTVRYAGDALETYHLAVDRERHADVYYMAARNRVWLARRNLPVLLAMAYLATWLTLDFARVRGGRNIREQIRGYRDGFRLPCGPRRPIRWRSAWRMAKVGRPPII